MCSVLVCAVATIDEALTGWILITVIIDFAAFFLITLTQRIVNGVSPY